MPRQSPTFSTDAQLPEEVGPCNGNWSWLRKTAFTHSEARCRGCKSSIYAEDFVSGVPLLPEVDIQLMAEIRRSPVEGKVVYPSIYRVLYIAGGAGFQPSTVCTAKTSNPSVNSNDVLHIFV